MKKWLIFGGGVLTGVIFTFVILFVLAKGKSNEDFKLFEKPGEIVNVNSFKVFQVLDDDVALVNGASNEEYDIYMGAVYLLINDEGKYYTDDEIIKVPNGKVVRKVGVYHYQTKSELDKTVSVIEIMDK
jgi:hypothetical protein